MSCKVFYSSIGHVGYIVWAIYTIWTFLNCGVGVAPFGQSKCIVPIADHINSDARDAVMHS